MNHLLIVEDDEGLREGLRRNFEYEGYRVCTNKPACGAFRGHGVPQPRFAFESHLDMIAKDLNGQAKFLLPGVLLTQRCK